MSFLRFKDLVEDVLRKVGNRSVYTSYKIKSIWRNVVGERLESFVKPISLRGKVLYLEVESSVWAQELSFTKKRIIESLNRALGEDLVEDLRFKVIGFRRREKDLYLGRKRLGAKDIRPVFEKILSIRDKELREVVARAFIKSLER